jgi:hypothetical protein
MKKFSPKGKSLSRKEQRNITGGIAPGGIAAGGNCFWVCKTPGGIVTFPVGNTCNIQWLIDPCIQYGGVTRGCFCT